jgi:hypothetical protein
LHFLAAFLGVLDEHVDALRQMVDRETLGGAADLTLKSELSGF